MRKPLRYLFALGAFAALIVGLSACAAIKEESLAVSQPSGLGPVRVHFVLCANEGESSGLVKCEGGEETETAQSMLVITVPAGWTGPDSFEALSSSNGPTLRYSRNQEVAKEFEFEETNKAGETEHTPPPGYENIGYLSAPYGEVEEEKDEWEVNVDVVPPAAGDVPYAGNFKAEISYGWRKINDEEGFPANRPINCEEGEPFGSEPLYSSCAYYVDEAEIPVTDLRVGPAAGVSAPVGGKATLTFPLAAATTVSPAPGFALTAATSIPGGSATPIEPNYNPTYDGTTHQGAPATRAVAVTMPATTPTGTYTVTLAGHSAAGGTVSNTGQIVVGKLSLGLGKAKRNLKKGTAAVSVRVPAAGKLLVSGKGVAKTTKSAPAPGTLKVTIRAKGRAKKQLAKTGKARVKPNFVFTPANGAPVARPKPLLLRRNG